MCTVPACLGQVNLPLRGFAKTGARVWRRLLPGCSGPQRTLPFHHPLPRFPLPPPSSAPSYSSLWLSVSLSVPLFLSPAVPLSFFPNPPALPPSFPLLPHFLCTWPRPAALHTSVKSQATWEYLESRSCPACTKCWPGWPLCWLVCGPPSPPL